MPRPKPAPKAGLGRVAPNGYRLADPLPLGEVVTDIQKERWMLGPAIATGGFGDIYVAHRIDANERAVKIPKSSIEKACRDWPYVIKVDRDTGPLFAEINFYVRAAKEQMIKEWKEAKGLSHLGMPHYVSSGRHAPGYRFLTLQRFKIDLEQHLKTNPLTVRDTLSIGSQIIDIVEFIHSRGYIHCDIKASNLLLASDITPGVAKTNPKKDPYRIKVYLVDFGNVEKYEIDNKHRPYEEDLRRAHNGTLEFCSRDAHLGALSRRTDIECLGYNLLYWLVEDLPWKHEKNHEQVSNLKKDYMSNVARLVEYCLHHSPAAIAAAVSAAVTDTPSPAKIKRGPGRPPKNPSLSPTVSPAKAKKKTKSPTAGLEKILNGYLARLARLEFDEEPDYAAFKALLAGHLTAAEGDAILRLPPASSTAVPANGAATPGANGVVNGKGKAGDKSPPQTPGGAGRGLKRKEDGHILNGNGRVVNGHPVQNGHGKHGRELAHTNGTSSKTITPPHKVSALKKKVQTLNPTPAMLEVMRKMESTAKHS